MKESRATSYIVIGIIALFLTVIFLLVFSYKNAVKYDHRNEQYYLDNTRFDIVESGNLPEDHGFNIQFDVLRDRKTFQEVVCFGSFSTCYLTGRILK